MICTIPRLLVSGLSGASGKTLVSLAIIAGWREKGYQVTPYKKGPDYIDAAWLSRIAGQPAYNLDTYLLNEERVATHFTNRAPSGNYAVIEGNRGLFDGMDLEGTYSSANLAKLLKTPVIVVVNCSKTTRTVAALVMGCQQFDPQVTLAGVVLNQVAGHRHGEITRGVIEKYCDLPVVGQIPRLVKLPFPERHLGLVPPQEHLETENIIQSSREIALQYLDMDRIQQIAENAEPLVKTEDLTSEPTSIPDIKPRIGIIIDSVFQFYYTENKEALEDAGAELVEISAVSDNRLPEIEALYIGGGFPETQAKLLADNESFRLDLKAKIEEGLPVYAECGGAMYLGQSLLVNGNAYPMVGTFPLDYTMEGRPQGHGYTILEVEESNPFFQVGNTVKGHEFHYSRPLNWADEKVKATLSVKRGHGFDGHRDGLSYQNTLACYTHIYAMGHEEWAGNFVKAAIAFRKVKQP